MISKITSVAVLGSGTMGSGIAALAAEKDYKVLLLDMSEEDASASKERLLQGKSPILSDPSKISNIYTGSFDEDFEKIRNFDWICEVVIENLEVKKDIFSKIDKYRNPDSIVSSNTSGIPLKAITEEINSDLLNNVCITHFFNPVKIMKLCELIPGKKTSTNTLQILKKFLENDFNKGVVHGKDTVNFIGNRIGCFMLLKGLYEGTIARKNGLLIEQIDALLSKPLGLPPTGLYGLIDLIGLDVMHSVGLNLDKNLPDKDFGRRFVHLPKLELEMYNKGQLGRKSGGGFYRIKKINENHKIKEVYDLDKKNWRSFKEYSYDKDISIIFEESVEGRLAWNIMGCTLWYAASLIPEIADDIVNVDRARRWGFAWSKGPFELIDMADSRKFIDKCVSENLPINGILKVLANSDKKTFYKDEQSKYLSLDGKYNLMV